MTADVVIEQRGDVLSITLNRPESGNQITGDISDAMIAALNGLAPNTKLIRLQGAGADFCRGRQSPPIDREKASALEFRQKIAEPALALYAALINARVPILGVVKGQASGVGCALAGLCDVAIASDNAVFQIPEMNHGIPPTLVMAALAGRVPTNALSYLVLTRERIDALRARELGIISKIVPADKLDAEADTLMNQMLECRGLSMQAVKEYMRFAPAMDLPGRVSLAANLIATVLSSR